MPRLLKINELEARRKALAQESDVYRETLKLQIQNLQLYGARTRERFTFLGRSNPWLMLLGPLFGAYLGRRKSGKMGLVARIIFAWKLLQRIRSFLPALFGRRKRRREADAPAAAI